MEQPPSESWENIDVMTLGEREADLARQIKENKDQRHTILDSWLNEQETWASGLPRWANTILLLRQARIYEEADLAKQACQCAQDAWQQANNESEEFPGLLQKAEQVIDSLFRTFPGFMNSTEVEE